MLTLSINNVVYALAQSDQTFSKLQAANVAFQTAFNSVFEAERAGANVSVLIKQLNDIAAILANSENAYRNGDSKTTIIQAEIVIPIAEKITTSAQEANQNAIFSSQQNSWYMITLSLIGSLVFVSALFLFWHWFKSRYKNNRSLVGSRRIINGTG